ncbi:MAG TPA: bifunctional adenosylcobinamide kinase/adenosylcobinamide-phosphate guanylyltransferase [Candidatus Faecousia intestinigallinarum]|nr:bifunctional adenosylcobinamide kinase/adenosylcobinamide-phosphate guanylyltransferase [Candidatus Faecousia intestinigallinarum]
MGKLILISGENNSGKSLYAERIAVQAGATRFYIATMVPHTEENRIRIQKHIRQRSGLNFHTLECPYCVAESAVSPDSVALLEDVSNLLSNAVFEKGGDGASVLDDIWKLSERCKTLVAVTISDLNSDNYDGETAAYIDMLNKLNQALSERAEIHIRMEAGSPVFLKGAPPYAD